MPGEGRGLSSRPTQDVARDREIGQPSNSEKCSEAADAVTRESEGGGRLPLLRSIRQDQPRRHSGACLCPGAPPFVSFGSRGVPLAWNSCPTKSTMTRQNFARKRQPARPNVSRV